MKNLKTKPDHHYTGNTLKNDLLNDKSLLKDIELGERSLNSHILITGKSGSGKSFLLKEMICHLLTSKNDVIVIGYSEYRFLTQILGGEDIDLYQLDYAWGLFESADNKLLFEGADDIYEEFIPSKLKEVSFNLTLKNRLTSIAVPNDHLMSSVLVLVINIAINKVLVSGKRTTLIIDSGYLHECLKSEDLKRFIQIITRRFRKHGLNFIVTAQDKSDSVADLDVFAHNQIELPNPALKLNVSSIKEALFDFRNEFRLWELQKTKSLEQAVVQRALELKSIKKNK